MRGLGRGHSQLIFPCVLPSFEDWETKREEGGLCAQPTEQHLVDFVLSEVQNGDDEIPGGNSVKERGGKIYHLGYRSTWLREPCVRRIIVYFFFYVFSCPISRNHSLLPWRFLLWELVCLPECLGTGPHISIDRHGARGDLLERNVAASHRRISATNSGLRACTKASCPSSSSASSGILYPVFFLSVAHCI